MRYPGCVSLEKATVSKLLKEVIKTLGKKTAQEFEDGSSLHLPPERKNSNDGDKSWAIGKSNLKGTLEPQPG